MAHHVGARAFADAAHVGDRAEEIPRVAQTHAPLLLAQKKGLVAGTRAHAQILPDRIGGDFVEEDATLFVALAENQGDAMLKIDILNVEPH